MITGHSTRLYVNGEEVTMAPPLYQACRCDAEDQPCQSRERVIVTFPPYEGPTVWWYRPNFIETKVRTPVPTGDRASLPPTDNH